MPSRTRRGPRLALALALIALQVMLHPGHARAWSPLNIAPEVAPSKYTAVFDTLTNRLVAFGGTSGSYDGLDILTLNNAPSWGVLPASRGPSSRADEASVLDPVRHRLVVIGGALQSDVWAIPLDGSSGWQQLAPSGTVPPGWSGHSAVYDPVRDRVLVFGGARPGVAYSNEVWALTLAPTVQWQLVTAAGGQPLARRDPSAVYDPLRDRMLVCDGQGATGPLQDVWALSLAGQPVWNVLNPAGAPPAARWGQAAIYDPRRDRMLLFSGRTTQGVWINDLWSLALGDSVAWTTLLPASSGYPLQGRVHATGFFDPRNDRLGIFGGQDSVADQRSTYAVSLTGSPSWKLVADAWTGSPGVNGTAFAADPQGKLLYAFGGVGNTLWVTNVGDVPPAWRRVAPIGTAPSPRYAANMVFDPGRRRLVVFGGLPTLSGSLLNDVWTIDPTPGNVWQGVAAAGTPPPPRYMAAAVFDSTRDRMVLFGGTATWTGHFFGDTYALDFGAAQPAWVTLPAGPTPRIMAACTVDPTRHRMLLFGGATPPTAPTGPDGALGDAWYLDLTQDTWSSVSPTGTGPTARWGAAASYDGQQDLLAIDAGATFDTPIAESWAIDPVRNEWVSLPAPPVGVVNGVSFYLRDEHAVVLFGGTYHSSIVAGWKHVYPPPPPPPSLTVTGATPLSWTAGVVNPVQFQVTTNVSGTPVVDYTVRCDREWPGLPFTGYVSVANGSAPFTVGIPVPDTAAGGAATLRLVASLHDRPDVADSCTVLLHDPGNVVPPFLHVSGSDPATWSWGASLPLNFTIQSDGRPGEVADYILTSNRAWRGTPQRGQIALASPNVALALYVSVPDTAAFGDVTFALHVSLQGNPSLVDSCSVVSAGSTIGFMGSTVHGTEVTLQWSQSMNVTMTYEVDRRQEGGPWLVLGSATSAPNGTVEYTDGTVVPGTRYDYRLALDTADGGKVYFGETSVMVWAFRLALAPPAPNPSVGQLTLWFDLAGPGPARLEVFDMHGRRALARDVGDMGIGHHSIDLLSGTHLPAGLYWARLVQGVHARTVKFTYFP